MSAIVNAIQSLFGGPASAQSLPPQNPNVSQNPNNPSQVANPGQGLPGTVANGVTAPNGVIPTNDGIQQPAPGQEGVQKVVSPLDGFGEIWKTIDTPADDPSTKPIFSGLDPKKVLESARQVDFAKAITPEQLSQIAKGGNDAVTAFAAAMNTVAQTVYAQSAVATTKIVEQALGKQKEQYDANLPSLVRKFSANENLRTENPLLNHPSVQPLVGALTEQLTRKNPGATGAEIQKQVTDYFAAMGTVFAPKAPETETDRRANRAAQSQDWSAFLS